MTEGKGHPLPASGEARHNEIPEKLEDEKGRGQDPAEITTPHPDAVNPDGEPYRYEDLGRGPGSDSGEPEPEPGQSRGERFDEQSAGGRGTYAASFDRERDGAFSEDRRALQDRGRSEAENEAE